jgi:hypothetical protein
VISPAPDWTDASAILEHGDKGPLRALQKENGRERRGAAAQTQLGLNAKVLPLLLKSHYLIRSEVTAYAAQRKISPHAAKVFYVSYDIAWNPDKILSPSEWAP